MRASSLCRHDSVEESSACLAQSAVVVVVGHHLFTQFNIAVSRYLVLRRTLARAIVRHTRARTRAGKIVVTQIRTQAPAPRTKVEEPPRKRIETPVNCACRCAERLESKSENFDTLVSLSPCHLLINPSNDSFSLSSFYL